MNRLSIAVLALFLIAMPATAQIKIQEVISPGGIKAWLVEEHAIPFIALKVGFRGGTSLDSAEKQGATNLMVGLLEEGTGDMDAAAFLKATEELAANFSYSARRDSVMISARVLTSNAPEALDLLKLAITKPAFNQVAFDRVKGQVISGLESEKSDPDAIAGKRMNQISYGEHAYSRPREGSVETVNMLTPADMMAAHRVGLTLDHMVVGVVGDVTAAQLGPMLDRLSGDLPKTGAVLPENVDFAATGKTTVIDFDTPQSVALWSHKGLDRHHPDFLAAYVMNHILGGGGFGSRLTDEVREKRGLTYGVYSYLAALDHSNFVGGSVASGNDKIAKALAVIRAEWARAAQGDFTAQELDDAKKYLTGSYPLRFGSNAQIAGALVSLQLDSLPIDYVNTRNGKVEALTLDHINRVARELLRPDQLQFVVVGKPVGLQVSQ